MTNYLIDTTPLAALLTNRRPIIELITPWMRAHTAVTSILVYGEVLEGLQGRPDYARRHTELVALLGEIVPYFTTHAIMQHYAGSQRAEQHTAEPCWGARPEWQRNSCS